MLACKGIFAKPSITQAHEVRIGRSPWLAQQDNLRTLYHKSPLKSILSRKVRDLIRQTYSKKDIILVYSILGL